jgi:hypothetical protein
MMRFNTGPGHPWRASTIQDEVLGAARQEAAQARSCRASLIKRAKE